MDFVIAVGDRKLSAEWRMGTRSVTPDERLSSRNVVHRAAGREVRGVEMNAGYGGICLDVILSFEDLSSSLVSNMKMESEWFLTVIAQLACRLIITDEDNLNYK